jgi:hypothetical protein
VLAYAAGSFVLPVIGAAEPGLTLAGTGLAMAIGGIAAVVLLGGHAIQEPAIDDTRRLLAEVPLFAGLPPGRLERAMRAAHVVAMQPGEAIVRQGEHADRFYVITEGEVEVTQAPPEGGPARVLRRLGRADFFGEIGLLSNVPRTATVTAVSQGGLLALERDAFNELVSSGPGLTYRLLDLHRGANTGAA